MAMGQVVRQSFPFVCRGVCETSRNGRELKLIATNLGIRKLDLGDKGGRLQFVERPNVDPMSVIKLIQGQPKLYQMDGPDKLRIKLDLPDALARLAAAKGLLTLLDTKH